MLNYIGTEKFNRYLVTIPEAFLQAIYIDDEAYYYKLTYPCTGHVAHFNDKKEKWEPLKDHPFGSIDEMVRYVNALNGPQ